MLSHGLAGRQGPVRDVQLHAALVLLDVPELPDGLPLGEDLEQHLLVLEVALVERGDIEPVASVLLDRADRSDLEVIDVPDLDVGQVLELEGLLDEDLHLALEAQLGLVDRGQVLAVLLLDLLHRAAAAGRGEDEEDEGQDDDEVTHGDVSF